MYGYPCHERGGGIRINGLPGFGGRISVGLGPGLGSIPENGLPPHFIHLGGGNSSSHLKRFEDELNALDSTDRPTPYPLPRRHKESRSSIFLTHTFSYLAHYVLNSRWESRGNTGHCEGPHIEVPRKAALLNDVVVTSVFLVQSS